MHRATRALDLANLLLRLLRDVRVDGGKVTVVITPTYSGCPAMDVIRRRIEETLVAEGIESYDVETVLSE